MLDRSCSEPLTDDKEGREDAGVGVNGAVAGVNVGKDAILTSGMTVAVGVGAANEEDCDARRFMLTCGGAGVDHENLGTLSLTVEV